MASWFSYIYIFFLTFLFSPNNKSETSHEKALMKEQHKKWLCTDTEPTLHANWSESTENEDWSQADDT